MTALHRGAKPVDGSPVRLQQLLDRLQCAGEAEPRVTLRAILDTIGRRSFGPLLLVPGLIMVASIPGVPTVCGLISALISVQLLFGRRSFWLPRWALRVGISRQHFERGLRLLRPPARIIDRFLRPRLSSLVHGRALPVIAAMCATMGLVVPAVEVIPMADTVVGAGLIAFGLALIAEDGALALVAVMLYLAALGLASLGAMGLIHGGGLFGRLF